MRKHDLDKAFTPTPRVFSNRVDMTLDTLKQDRPRPFPMRPTLAALALTLLFCGISLAALLGREAPGSGDKLAGANGIGQAALSQPFSPAPSSAALAQERPIIARARKSVTKIQAEVLALYTGPVKIVPLQSAWENGRLHLTLRLFLGEQEAKLFELRLADQPHDQAPAKPLLILDAGSLRASTRAGFASLPVKEVKASLQEDGSVIATLEIEVGQTNEEALEKFSFPPTEVPYQVSFSQDGLKGKVAAQPSPTPPGTSKEGDAASRVQAKPSPTPPGTRDPAEAMIRLQHALADLGYYQGEADGVYGSDLKEAIAAFQRDHFLWEDGIAGPATQAAILHRASQEEAEGALEYLYPVPSEADGAAPFSDTLIPGSRGREVAGLQSALTALGYYQGKADGAYSNDVKAAVAAFQEANSLYSDGIAGPVTKAAILYGAQVSISMKPDTAAAMIGFAMLRIDYQATTLEDGVQGVPVAGCGDVLVEEP